jgi:enamine deaminase RidA (YjgF/YER057c/UK114 family)
MVFLAGMVGRDANGRIVAGVYAQTKQAIENIAGALEAAGASLKDVVRTRLFVVNIDSLEDAARAHLEAFGSVMPASTIVEVSRLATAEMLVEIEADAVITGAH